MKEALSLVSVSGMSMVWSMASWTSGFFLPGFVQGLAVLFGIGFV
jgi:hypothetical protein